MAKRHVFEKETAILERIQEFLKRDGVSNDDYRQELEEVKDYYEDLLDQGMLITKVSDRLQNKLNNLNSKLNDKNTELQDTIDELTKAKVGRRATTIVLLVAIVLFIVSEGILEPQIEANLGDNVWMGLLLKGVIALLLKPIETFTEKYLMRRALKAKQAEKEVSK
jgi:predicted ribosome quality control (RQC) complex YloA/Tae2 family protein